MKQTLQKRSHAYEITVFINLVQNVNIWVSERRSKGFNTDLHGQAAPQPLAKALIQATKFV